VYQLEGGIINYAKQIKKKPRVNSLEKTLYLITAGERITDDLYQMPPMWKTL
jgi:hypothetical protein